MPTLEHFDFLFGRLILVGGVFSGIQSGWREGSPWVGRHILVKRLFPVGLELLVQRFLVRQEMNSLVLCRVPGKETEEKLPGIYSDILMEPLLSPKGVSVFVI